MRKKGTQDIVANHSIAAIKMVQSFNPNYFIWSVASVEKKSDDTFRLRSVSAEGCLSRASKKRSLVF